MKKLVCVLLALGMLFTSTAFAEDAEILFRGIPWGSSVSDAINSLPEMRTYGGDDESVFYTWSWSDMTQSSSDTGKPYNSIYCACYPDGSLKVAGYSVAIINLIFLYSVEDGKINRSSKCAQLFSAWYLLSTADAELAFEDLSEKLTSLYGKGKKGESEYGDRTIVWEGSSETGVCLTLSSDSVAIYYGRTDDSLLEAVNDALVAEEIENSKGNVDGL